MSSFDSVPHGELMKSVARRISDRYMLKLIKMWLEVPVEETDEQGRKQRRNPNKKHKRGTPQGSPISPLLANIYMRRYVLGWKTLGWDRRLTAYVINYADDFVICCRGTAAEAAQAMRGIMERLKLQVNETKTRICRLPNETFNFLGYTIGRCYSRRTGNSYIGTWPSKQSVQRVCRAISESTSRRWTWQEEAELVRKLNQRLIGWANYYRLGPVSKSYKAIDAHARHRLRRWLCVKHKVPGRGTARYPDEYLEGVMGLVKLENQTRNLPWAKA